MCKSDGSTAALQCLPGAIFYPSSSNTSPNFKPVVHCLRLSPKALLQSEKWALAAVCVTCVSFRWLLWRSPISSWVRCLGLQIIWDLQILLQARACTCFRCYMTNWNTCSVRQGLPIFLSMRTPAFNVKQFGEVPQDSRISRHSKDWATPTKPVEPTLLQNA